MESARTTLAITRIIMSKQLGIILPNLGNNQLAFFTMLNVPTLMKAGVDTVLFFEDNERPIMKPPCAIMNASELWDFPGDVIATTLNNATYLSNLVKAKRRILYLWDLEWLRHNKNFIRNMEILRSNIELAARSESHKKAIEKYCNKEVKYIIEDCDFSGLM